MGDPLWIAVEASVERRLVSPAKPVDKLGPTPPRPLTARPPGQRLQACAACDRGYNRSSSSM